MADTKKCAHEICKCVVNEDDKYCSPQCENAGEQDIVAIECECRHPGCD